MLVDHLAAAASDKDYSFANTTIKCPPKPNDYTCPKVLDSKNKEEVKKQLCQYETVLTGTITLLPDNEQSDTRCGPMKIEKPAVFKSDEDNTEMTDKMAVVFGKGCQLKQLYESQTGQKLDSSEPRVHVLVKSPIPSGTKYVVVDGSNMDLMNAAFITKDEIMSAFKACPKAK
jgi:hypothetical protein